MATVKSNPSVAPHRGRSYIKIALLFFVILLAVLAYNYSFIKGQLSLGTAYGARVACSCHYVGGRDLADCEKDFEPGMELISLTLDDEKRRVSASVPLLASATAEFREGWGCIMLSKEQLSAE